MLEFPTEMGTWRKRASWLLQTFQSTAKGTRELLKEMLDFFNGDTTSCILTHWCAPNSVSGEPCCKDDTQALNKAISLLTSFLTRGYGVPLLYRMKHYAPAASFIRVGCCLHNILSQVLSVDKDILTPADRPGSDMSNVIDTLLGGEKKKTQGGSDNPTSADFEALVGKLLDEDKNYAAQNGARCQMVQKEISQSNFHQASIIVDCIVQRMERGINFFLRRTSILYNLTLCSHTNPDCEKLKLEASDRFLKVVRGELGESLICDFIDLLNNQLQECIDMGLDGTQTQLNQIFQMAVNCMTDLYRRMVLEFMVPPFTLLRLARADPAEFAKAWNDIRQKFLHCEGCVDAEFTTPFLRKYPFSFSIPPSQDDVEHIKDIQEVLVEVSIWCPLTSDAVEILNGQSQWATSRRGTVLKRGRPAVETSLLANAVKQHCWLTEKAGARTLPNKSVASHIRRFSGTKSSNQYTARNPALWTACRQI